MMLCVKCIINIGEKKLDKYNIYDTDDNDYNNE